MKKYLPLLAFFTAAASALYYLKQKAKAGMNLRYSPVDVGIDTQKTQDSNYQKLFFNVKFNLINDENVSVNVKYIELDLYVNQIKVGTIKNTDGFVVPARSFKFIKLETSFTSQSIILLISDLLINGFDTEVAAVGFVKTDLGNLVINFKM